MQSKFIHTHIHIRRVGRQNLGWVKKSWRFDYFPKYANVRIQFTCGTLSCAQWRDMLRGGTKIAGGGGSLPFFPLNTPL